MRRREIVAGLLGLTASMPLAARAQQSARPIIGFLGAAPASGSASRVESLRAGLRDFGYTEDNTLFEFRWVEQPEQLRQFAAEIVERQPAAIVTSGNAATLAAKAATSTIPIVFSVADDPVRLGFVTSFNNPGGHLTGVSQISGSLGPKRLELLRELVPGVTLIAMLINPRNPAEGQQRDEAAQASAIGQQILVLHASNEREIDAAFEDLNRQRARALIVGADAFFTGRRDQITALAAHYGIPAIYPWREYVQAGGLMSYGISLAESYRQMGVYVGRILRGVKPAELPVMRPTRIELILNLKTAQAMGIEISAKVLALADAVIE